MSIFRTGNSPTVTPEYTGLQIQTAVNALPIPIVWGQAKLAPNVVWYNNFQVHPQGGGGGGKGGLFNSGNTGYSYTAAVILALCEGPITAINQIWKDQSTYTLSQLGLSLFTGTTPQGVWSYLASTYPSQALAYQGTAYVSASNYSLGTSATLDNHNFEVRGFRYGSGPNNVDADPAQVVSDFLTNPQYGVGFPASSVATATLFGAGNDASYQTYCAAIGVAFSPALANQEPASGILARWLQLTNTAAVWSGGQLKFLPYGDTATVAGTVQTASISIVVPPLGVQTSPTPTVFVVPPSRYAGDLGVSYSVSGSALTYIGAATPTQAGQYGIAPAGTYLFAAADANAGVGIRYQYTTAASFAPDVTPIYNLTDDDFKVDGNADPLQVTRSDPYQSHNVWRLEIAERANAYNMTPIESRDQNAIETYGMRIAPTVTAHEICDPNVALVAGQLMLQRALYIRNTYKFRLSWEYCLLDPMDLVTVSDQALGLTNAAVRITEIEEDENGFLEVTAEEFPAGIATATLYPTQTAASAPINRNAAAPAINAPIIFEPTDELGGGLQIWAAVSGQGALWGGANVFASYQEGGNYVQVGTVTAPARMGVTAADLPAVAVNPTGRTLDQVNTLAVDLSLSGGVLGSATVNDALAADDPCYVGGEIIAYANATLTAPHQYDLSYLPRGAYGTESLIADHPPGTPFARLDGAIFKFPYDQHYIGSTIYFKFQSFNVWGGGLQSLADCVAYPYQITGSALASPLPNVENLYTNYEAGFQKIYWDEISDFRNGVVYEIRQGSTWATALFIRTQAHPPFIAQGNGTYLIMARCQPLAGLIVYSETPSAIVITGNQLSLNLLATWDEKATGWSGTFQNSIGIAGGNLRLGGAEPILQSLVASGAVASGDVLSFASLPSTVVNGLFAQNLNNSATIPANAFVAGTTATTVLLSNNVVAPGISNGFWDYGSVASSVATSYDYGAVAGAFSATIDYGSTASLASPDVIVFSPPILQSLSATVAAASGNVLTFTAVPPTIVAGLLVSDATTLAALVAGTTVLATTLTTVTLSAPVAGPGVVAGDTIIFAMPDALSYGGIIADTPVYYTIPAAHIVNAGSVVQASVNGTTQIVGVPVGQNVLAITDFLNDPDVLGSASTQYVDGWIEIATSQDGVNWGPWQKFVPGVFPGMKWNFRLALQSQSPNVIPFALAFSFAVQLPARIDHYQNQSVPSAGSTITFQRDGVVGAAPLNGGPGANNLPYVSVSWQPQPGDTYTISGLSLSQLTIQFSNGGTPVPRSGVNVTVEGF